MADAEINWEKIRGEARMHWYIAEGSRRGICDIVRLSVRKALKLGKRDSRLPVDLTEAVEMRNELARAFLALDAERESPRHG